MPLKKEQVLTTQGDSKGSIESLISFLNEAKEKGATHYEMIWSQDPFWSFKWLETYRIKSNEEIRQENIKTLESKLERLK